MNVSRQKGSFGFSRVLINFGSTMKSSETAGKSKYKAGMQGVRECDRRLRQLDDNPVRWVAEFMEEAEPEYDDEE